MSILSYWWQSSNAPSDCKNACEVYFAVRKLRIMSSGVGEYTEENLAR